MNGCGTLNYALNQDRTDREMYHIVDVNTEVDGEVSKDGLADAISEGVRRNTSDSQGNFHIGSTGKTPDTP